MVPSRNLHRRHYDSYGGYFSDSFFDFEKPEFMGSLINGEDQRREEEEEEAAGTSSRDDAWLQLGTGAGIRPAGGSSGLPQREIGGVELSTELELFAPRPPALMEPMNIAMFPPPAHFGVFYPRDAPWGFWNAGPTAFLPPVRSFVVERAGAVPGEMRVVNRGARTRAGVWFLLKASQRQVREPFLPQIPKSYLRIKDGTMTVRVLKKYLMKKLDLENESEVEISCRGQTLLPFLTLQHIRDNIWPMRETSTSLTLSPCDEHLMTLQYDRSS